MSSILKALKKLENETTEKEPRQFDWPQPVDAKSSFNAKIQDRFAKKFLSYKLAILFFCSTTLILLFFITWSLYSKKTVVAVSSPIGNEDLVRVLPEDRNTEDKIIAAVDKTENRSPEKMGADAADTETQDEIVRAAVELTPEKQTAADDVTDETIHNEPEKRTDAGWLTLQGISWSGTPSRRMAVINSTIVREGKTVEGGKVVRIDKKYVVIEKDGEELMLAFD